MPVTAIHYKAEAEARKSEPALDTNNVIAFAIRYKLTELGISFEGVYAVIAPEELGIYFKVWGIIVQGKDCTFEAEYLGNHCSLIYNLQHHTPLTLELEFHNLGESSPNLRQPLSDRTVEAIVVDGLKLMVIAVVTRLVDSWIKEILKSGILINLRIVGAAVVLLVFWSYIPENFLDN